MNFLFCSQWRQYFVSKAAQICVFWLWSDFFLANPTQSCVFWQKCFFLGIADKNSRFYQHTIMDKIVEKIWLVIILCNIQYQNAWITSIWDPPPPQTNVVRTPNHCSMRVDQHWLVGEGVGLCLMRESSCSPYLFVAVKNSQPFLSMIVWGHKCIFSEYREFSCILIVVYL